MRRAFAASVVACALLLAAVPLPAFERTNVPLKNWGGFAVYRDAVYDDLERLVTAGLADRTLLSTKPLTRIEAARIVARALDKIRGDRDGRLNGRRDLEPVVDRLMEEFRVELASLGVKVPGEPVDPPGFLSPTPVDRLQVVGGYASERWRLVNNQGLTVGEGFYGGTTFESRLQVGDFLSFYLQPELIAGSEFGLARLATGYAKLTLFNVELFAGRESLWWGPGLRGSLILSDNARALDQLRIGAAEPFLLPWIGQWVGPTKILFFVAQLEQDRDHPHAKLAGARITVAPFTFLELGISRTMMFNGDPSPKPDFIDFLRLLFDPPAGDNLAAEPELRSNNLFALDAEVRLGNLSRFGIPASDVRLYGEFGWDDTCCETAYVPLKEAASFLIGVHAMNVFGREGLDARFEYANSSRLSFVHSSFTDGYRTRGHVISHVMGSRGEDWYARATNRLTPDVMLGIELNRAVIGSTVASQAGAEERRLGAGIDLSVRFWRRYAVFAQYQIADVTNRGFVAGDDGVDHLLRVEFTRSFR